MYAMVHKLFNRAARRLMLDLGWARRYFMAQRGRLRILTYHGVVPDHLADRDWVPSHYVSLAQFERQMALLAELGPAPRLGDAWSSLQHDPHAPPAVCITFDDGMADNHALALPVLQKYGHSATFFLTTGLMSGQQLLLNDVIRLLRGLGPAALPNDLNECCRRVLIDPGYAKTVRASHYLEELQRLWSASMGQVEPAALDGLQVMTWDQARALRNAGMEMGAHTVNHVILGREQRRTRRDEILGSVARVRAMLGAASVPFAYPNGLPGDYETFDQDILAAIGTPYAVTEQPGWNDSTTPALELRRNCIGRHCSEAAFLAQVYGVDDMLMRGRRSA